MRADDRQSDARLVPECERNVPAVAANGEPARLDRERIVVRPAVLVPAEAPNLRASNVCPLGLAAGGRYQDQERGEEALSNASYSGIFAATSQIWPSGSVKLAVRRPHSRSSGPFSSSMPLSASSEHVASVSSTQIVS